MLFLFVSLTLIQVGRVNAENLSYQKDIAPLLTKYCVDCHGANKPKSGVRFDSYESTMAKSRKVSVVAGELGKSKLYQSLIGEAKLMPPKKSGVKMTTDEIEKIKL